MVTVNINLYEFNELREEAQNEALQEHLDFINDCSIMDSDDDDEPYEYTLENDREVVIDNILANAYLFYKDGSLASCTTYVGKHEKAGTTEFKLGGEIYNITQ